MLPCFYRNIILNLEQPYYVILECFQFISNVLEKIRDITNIS